MKQSDQKSEQKYEAAMKLALNAAEKYAGATAPNPPVGCIALDKNGKTLLGAAHRKAGTEHAEALVLSMAQKLGKLKDIETLVVTLEPCNHQGKTPACTETILKHKNIRRIVYGSIDPNPKVKGGGAQYLQSKGLEVIGAVMELECDFLIRAFAKFSLEKRPYITIKSAVTCDGSMIPPEGQKTFTSKPALILAHELRKRADAIWTGSGTVLADNPQFTVRWVPDHQDKKRILMLSDRRKRIGEEWLSKARKNGFTVHWADNFEGGLDFLGKSGVLEVLVEAGPALRDAWLKSGLWDEHVIITQGKEAGEDDHIEIQFREEIKDVHGNH